MSAALSASALPPPSLPQVHARSPVKDAAPSRVMHVQCLQLGSGAVSFLAEPRNYGSVSAEGSTRSWATSPSSWAAGASASQSRSSARCVRLYTSTARAACICQWSVRHMHGSGSY